ncbi:TetR/AcrR family transcriptional regulator [Streptococcus gordonii]|uniref:TetR/AcrR family transcriptional regulator n=1 Tax=Streptococcus gordonii TaxID=1302 RepID=UPI001C8CE6F3|nr:TetR/AcrR family transcriptional regulator [Streptococcus gordonii]MBX9096065.1 TetR/AcrR family transcriptional regulator [Streptococcus gordonii]
MKRNTAQLKEQFIQTGIDEIGKNGIEKLSLRTIAKACGVTHGTPYRHFESKECYLKVVLARLSLFLNQEINENIDTTGSARDQLTQLGLNFIIFAKTYPHFFEALFIKFPFKYMKVTHNNILLESDLPGFDKFKELVLKLREEENFSNSEAESLFHFWSFITGLAVLTNSPIGQDLDPQAIQSTIEHMLDIYIKGERS